MTIVVSRTYVSKSFRLMGYAGVLISVALTGSLVTSPQLTWWGAAITGVVGTAGGVAAWTFYGAPRLSLYDDRVEVRNPLRRHVVSIDDIESITVGQRLGLRRRNGDVTKVWCVQAANISPMFGRRSHVDRVAAEVGEWVDARRSAASG